MSDNVTRLKSLENKYKKGYGAGRMIDTLIDLLSINSVIASPEYCYLWAAYWESNENEFDRLIKSIKRKFHLNNDLKETAK